MEVDGLHCCSLNDGMTATDLYILPKRPAGNQLEWIKGPSRGSAIISIFICLNKGFGIHYMLSSVCRSHPLYLDILQGLGCFFLSSLCRASSAAVKCWWKHQQHRNQWIYWCESPYESVCVGVCVQTSYVCPSKSLESHQFPHRSLTRRFLVRYNQSVVC